MRTKFTTVLEGEGRAGDQVPPRRLGYADQAHFIRDFKRTVGRSPAEYAKGLV